MTTVINIPKDSMFMTGVMSVLFTSFQINCYQYLSSDKGETDISIIRSNLFAISAYICISQLVFLPLVTKTRLMQLFTIKTASVVYSS